VAATRGVYRGGSGRNLRPVWLKGERIPPSRGKNSRRYMGHIDDCIVSSCHKMRFLGSKFTQNALAAGAPPRSPLGKLKRSPRPLADFRGPLRGRERERRGKMKERKGKRGIGEGKEGRKGREEGREGKGKEEGKGGEGSLRHCVRGDRRPWLQHQRRAKAELCQ